MVISAFQMDPLDVALISELQRDGRQHLIKIAKKLQVSHGTVRNRLERLLAEGAIRVTAVVDPIKAGFPTQVLVGLTGDLRRMEETEERLAAIDEVYFVATMTGQLDFVIFAAFPSDDDLRHFLAEKLSKIPGIRSTQTFHLLKISKRTWQWRIPIPTGRRSEKQAATGTTRG